jgi:hypothetical protein
MLKSQAQKLAREGEVYSRERLRNDRFPVERDDTAQNQTALGRGDRRGRPLRPPNRPSEAEERDQRASHIGATATLCVQGASDGADQWKRPMARAKPPFACAIRAFRECLIGAGRRFYEA